MAELHTVESQQDVNGVTIKNTASFNKDEKILTDTVCISCKNHTKLKCTTYNVNVRSCLELVKKNI